MHATESSRGTDRDSRPKGARHPPTNGSVFGWNPPSQRSVSERDGCMHEQTHTGVCALSKDRLKESRAIVVHDLIAHCEELPGLEGLGEEVS